MEGREKYTLGQAQTEAPRLQEKVQRGEAKNLEEAELQIEAEKIIQNPEATIHGFVDSKLSDLQQIEGWEGRLQMNIKNRLAGNPDKRYIIGLSQSTRGMSEEKEKIVTAAYLYELEHRDEMPKIPNYNPTVLFRLTLDFAKTRDDLLGVAMKKYLDSVPLEEIYKNFRGVKNITPQDLPRLAEVALERISREQESSKKVLGDAETDLFRPAVNVKKKALQAESFFMPVGNYNLNADRFAPEVLNYLLTNTKEENPDIFGEVVKRIDVELERIAHKNIPLDEKEFAKKLEEVPYSERDYLRRDYQKLIAFREMTQAVPVLSTAYNEIIEKRRMEEAEKTRVEGERQRQLELEHEQERIQGEEEKRKLAAERDKMYQEKQAQRRERANLECDRLLGELAQFRVDNAIIDEQISSRIQNIKIGEWGQLLYPNEWEILRHGEEAIPTKLSSLDIQESRLFWSQDADHEKRESLHDVWKKRKTELGTSIKSALIENKEKIYTAINSRLSLVTENPDLNGYEDYLRTLKTVGENTKRFVESSGDENTRQFLQGIVDIAERKLTDALPIYENLRAQVEESEKRESMASAQEEYLRDQIERQTDYLKEIYAIGTGLGLEYVKSQASSEAGDVVGSVFLGRGLSIKQGLELELKLELEAVGDNITLEMGKDLESVKKRMAMVNWVAPHEIAHLVDIASDMHKHLFTEEELAPMNAVVNNWRGNNQELARDMMSSIVKETTIDAVGYRMLKEYGSANPFDQTKAERITAALRGYIAMMDVLENILQTHAEDEEMKSRYSAILLREIADGETITEEARTNEVDEKIIRDTEHEIEKLRTVFENLNRETHFIDEGQVRNIIEMCKGYFKKAEQVPFVRRPRE